MATFPAIAPSQSSTYDRQFRVNAISFGDGYRQRSANGINNKPRTLNLTWDLKPAADIATIKDFIDLRGGVTVFEYTPIGEAVELQWTCGGYNETPGNALYSTITATFIQEFDI